MASGKWVACFRRDVRRLKGWAGPYAHALPRVQPRPPPRPLECNRVRVYRRGNMSDQMSSSVDAVIVGAGFAGLYMLHRLRGIGVSARIYEAGSGVGGTWFWNRYPGARCDVESLEYCYTFSEDLDREWQWSERYASQPEILRYLNYVADRFDLRRDIELNCRVMSVIFNESTNLWNIQTDRYESVLARFGSVAKFEEEI